MNWHDWTEYQDKEQVEPEQLPHELMEWSKPFHAAYSSGAVDGGKEDQEGRITNGDVSE